MLRWSEEQLREHHAKRQGKRDANAEAKAHVKDVPRSKYRNKKVVIDGRKFDSKAEGARYVELKRQEEAGLIFNLQCQVPFALEIAGVLICKYVADFVYLNEHASRVVEDVKGVRTDVYSIKAKLMKAIYGVAVQEVKVMRKKQPARTIKAV
mgnify:CR=1 FL=1